ncbi:MAG TPA: hypothetical protein VHT68_22545 [Pseudolabrys sp.]|nr:hypothetical protein [Pseudolabrys sp.]
MFDGPRIIWPGAHQQNQKLLDEARRHAPPQILTDEQEVAMKKARHTSSFSTHGSLLPKLTFLGAGLGAGFALAIATMSFAQSYDPDAGTGNIAYMVQPDGSTSRLGGKTGTVNAAGHAMAMAHGSELKPGSVLYRSNSKLYAINNQMIDGKMLEEGTRGWLQ